MADAEKEVVKSKDRERKADKWLGEISDTEKEYIRILVERVTRNGKENLTDNLKAKKAMQKFKENLPEKYYPRGKRNIKELADWKLFFENNEEWLQTSKPEMYKKIKYSLENEKKIKMKRLKRKLLGR
jgi:excinuclease UvrABC helicase subunit UvrB